MVVWEKAEIDGIGQGVERQLETVAKSDASSLSVIQPQICRQNYMVWLPFFVRVSRSATCATMPTIVLVLFHWDWHTLS